MPPGKTPKPAAGATVQVNPAVEMPEFPSLKIEGWKGTVMETSGSGAKMKVILEWDEQTVQSIPEDYRTHCESQGLLFTMACLPASDLHVVT